MAKITYYDFSDIDYASLFLQGFLDLQKKGELIFRVTKSIPEELRDLDLPTWITFRKPPSTSVFRYEDAGTNFLFCIDANDHNGQYIDLADTYPGYHLQLIEQVRYYFKVNYKAEVIASNPSVTKYVDKIVPIALVYPLRISKIRPVLPSLTTFSGQRWPRNAARQRLSRLRRLLPLQEYRRMRQLPRDLDVIFITTHYSKKRHEEINAWRLDLVRALRSHSSLNTLVGFINMAGELKGEFAKYEVQPLPFEAYITQLARSKIGLYVRGTFGALSFKFGHYFALGKPVVGVPLLNNRQNMYAYDDFSEQFNYTEPVEIADKIAELSADPIKLQQLRDTNTATFENHFTPEAMARYILTHIKST